MTPARGTMARLHTQVILLLCWALLHALSYPRLNLGPLSHVSLVPLSLLALYGTPRWRVAGLTYFAWAMWAAYETYWIKALSVPAAVAMAGVMPLYFTAYVLLLPVIHRRFPRLPLTLALPVLWVALEWLRGAYFMGGFPYFLQGQSQPTAMIQLADLFGAYGVSFVVCMSNGLVCDVIVARDRGKEGPRDQGKTIWRLIPRSLGPSVPLLWLSVTSGTLIYGLWRIGQAPGVDAPAIRVAVVQTNVPQSHKIYPNEERDRANFAQLMRMCEESLADRPDLIAWPETMSPQPLDAESSRQFDKPREYRRAVEEFTARHGVALLAGAQALFGEPGVNRPPGSRYNSAFLFTPTGEAGRYDKIHRAPFGEYMPWVENWPRGRKWLQSFTPYTTENSIIRGAGPVVFNVVDSKGEIWRFATPICFEDVMTYLPRRMVWQGGVKQADFLVNISNDGWFVNTPQGNIHEQIGRFRCVENRVPMARAVNTGISGFIDSTGRVIGRVEVDGKTQNVAGVKTMELRRDGRKTLFSIIGDALPIGCVGASLLVLALAALQRRR